MAKEYLNVLTTYGIYAKTLWHDAEPGGYWGDDIEAKNQNGGVRGMCNTLLTYAMLVHGLDNEWLATEDAALLTSAGLTRAELLRYSRAELDYLVAHHKSIPDAKAPQWGFGWQSSLWLASAGPAALLLWNDLSPAQKDGLTSVAAAEADRIASTPPKGYHPGDTGAEENAWNTAAPAVALALAPNDPRADNWYKALRVYATNVYSHPADRTSTATVGADKVSDLVSTANIFDDYTLENHGFFHPDYVQASGESLGEAWLYLALADRIHGTHRADDFKPYAMHHVRDVWEKVGRPLMLPSGELAFPCGNDWTFHCSTVQSYLAFIATALGDEFAASAEREGIKHVQRRRAVSPPGRLLGDSNLEWWWEPLVCQRASTALLQHEFASDREKGKPQRHRVTQGSTEATSETRFYPDAKVWTHRNDKYLVGASWGSKRMVTFYPLDHTTTETRYMTLPMVGGILPQTITTATAIIDGGSVVPQKDVGMAKYPKVPALWMTGAERSACEVYALPQSVLILANTPLGAFAVENDSLTTPGRTISCSSGERHFPSLGVAASLTARSWLTVDGRLGVITSGTLAYRDAGKWNGKSVAWDQIVSDNSLGALQLACIENSGQAHALASNFRVTASSVHVSINDSDGQSYRFLPAYYRPKTENADLPLQCCGSDFDWY
jgi:hypothetical protein